MVRLTDRPDMASDVYRGRKTTKQQQQKQELFGEDVVVEEAYVCVAWWKGAAVTFGNSALFKDRYIVYDLCWRRGRRLGGVSVPAN